METVEDFDLDEIDVIAVVLKKSYRGPMCVGIRSDILRPTVCIFESGAVSNLVYTAFVPFKWRNRIRPILNMHSKPASNRPVHVIDKVMTFLQLSNLHLNVPFRSVDSLVVLLIVRTSFIDRFFKGIFPLDEASSPSREAKWQLYQIQISVEFAA